MSNFVALLRGINVGGKHLVPMAELRAVCAGLGWTDVATYIQSGNVVFRANGEPVALASALAQALGARFGFAVPVVVRSGTSMGGVLSANPFSDESADSNQLYVALLSDVPAAGAMTKLDPNRSPPDRFALVGADLFLQLPNGAARTKLTVDWMERHLGVVATIRNLRTVAALSELVAQLPA